MTTYRDDIQGIIRSIWKTYDQTGAMRDLASTDEKNAWNTARGHLYRAAIALSELDNNLEPERAQMTGILTWTPKQ